MINNSIVILVVLCCFNFSFSQHEQEELWYKSSSKLEVKQQHYITSTISDSLLYNEVKSFLYAYIKPTSLNDQEVAISISVERLNGEGIKYTISYLTEYYNKIDYRNIHQICLFEDKIAFVNYDKLDGVSIKKEILYALLKDRYPKEYKYLKDSYLQYKKQDQDVYPVIISSLEHDLPYWEIIINKDGGHQRTVKKQ